MAYETVRNDIEIENIEVDEPVIQVVQIQSRSQRFKQEEADDANDPLYSNDYDEITPRRKSPTKRQSSNGEYPNYH